MKCVIVVQTKGLSHYSHIQTSYRDIRTWWVIKEIAPITCLVGGRERQEISQKLD